MEWFETDDTRAFVATADRYAAWLEENLDNSHQRVGPADWSRDVVVEAGRAGLLSAPLPEQLGGVGLGWPARMSVMDHVARGRAGAALIIAVHWAALSAFTHSLDGERAGSILSGTSEKAGDSPWILGVALPAEVSEETAAPARSVGGGSLSLSGEFLCPVHPAACEMVVMQVPDPDGGHALLYAPGADLAGSARESYPGSGLLEVPTARLFLDEFAADASMIAGRGDDAAKAAKAVRRALYLGLAAAMVGNADKAMNRAFEYAGEREQTGRLIINHQDVARMLEGMAVEVEAARGMVFAASVIEDVDEALVRARRAHLFAGGACERACLDAVQALGGYGYMEDYGLERRLRDHKTLQCMLGTHFPDWVGGV